MDTDNDHIDINNVEELKRWRKLLCCKEEDLVQAVLIIGNSAKMVDMYLYLNQKKLTDSQKRKDE